MKRFLLIAAVSALAVAKPGLYKEKEDFQYSRSSSDDGTKAGFYGAQRGNMGGNFERAHNMDGLAQNQMSGLVRQVEGELGDGSMTRTGSVFTAANSRGIYGSGHYDLSNLEGRNFQEGSNYGDSQSSLTSQSGYDAQSSASHNAAYSSSHSHSSRHHSGFSGYQSSGLSDQTSNLQESTGTSGQENSLQAADRVSQYDYGGQVASGQYSRSGYHGQSAYDQTRSNSRLASDYGSNTQSKVIAMPVRVVVRPGTRVAIPIAAQTYDTNQYGATYDQNLVNNQAELLSNHDQQTLYKASNEPKHYESAYSYRKQWEKHDTIPASIPEASTTSPFPKNSELYEDTQAHTSGHEYDLTGTDSQRSLSSDSYSRYNGNVKSALSSQSRHQTNYNNQNQRETLASNTNDFLHGTQNSAVNTNQIEDVSKPKSYQSSYSYHKSWERQGDPYVIKPTSNDVSDVLASQRLTAASSNQGTWSSQNYGSRHQHSNQNYLNGEDCDCDENGHIRVARSYNVNDDQVIDAHQQNQNIYDQVYQQSQNLEDLGQQTQSKWDNLENLGQQTQSMSDKLEDLGQQSQNKWDNIEDLGQQTQSMSDKLDDAGQQIQTNLEELGQQTQTQWDKIENAGQQTQNKWDNFNEQTNQHNQQTQNTWNTLETGKQDIYGQQTQNRWYSSYSTPQETHVANSSPQGTFKQPKSFTNEDFEQQLTQKQNLGQHTQHSWNVDALDHKPTNTDENTGGKPVHDHAPYNFYTNPTYFHNIGYNNMPSSFEQADNHDYFRQHSQIYNSNWNMYTGSRTHNSWQEQFINENPHANINYQTSTQGTSGLSSLWDKIDNIEKELSSSTNNDGVNTNENSYGQGQQTFISHINLGQDQTENGNNIDLTQTHHPWQTNPFNEVTSTTGISIDHSNDDNIRTSDIGRGDIGPDDSSKDKSETSKSTTETAPHAMFISSPVDKSYKTPEEIERLSLTKWNTTISDITTQKSNDNSIDQSNNEQSNGSLSITSNSQLSSTEYQHRQPSQTIQTENRQVVIEKEESLMEVPSTNTNSNKSHHIPSNKASQFEQDTNLQSTDTQSLYDQGPVQVNQQSTEKLTEEFGLQNANIHKLNSGLNIDQQSTDIEQLNLGNIDQNYAEHQLGMQGPLLDQSNLKNLNQHNIDQQFETLIKESDNLTPPHAHDLVNFGQTSNTFDQQNTDQQFETYGQQSENLTPQNSDNVLNLEQQINTFDQQNTDQQFETFGPQSEDQSPQNADNLINLEQQINTFDQQNTDQQFETLGQQNENLTPQNADNLINLVQQMNTFDQQNTDQKFETLGQQSENLNLQSADNLINLEPKITTVDQQNKDQQFETIGQQSESLNSQNANNVINLEQKSDTFNQKNMDKQFLGLGKPNENPHPQNTNNVINLEQQSDKFDQQNMNQQFEGFSKPNEILIPLNADNLLNLDQEINTFDQQNMDQQFETPGKADVNLAQQNADNLVNFGQQTDLFVQQNMDQQFDAIGKPNEDLTQQNTDNLVNFGQQTDLFVQQNMDQQFDAIGKPNEDLTQQNTDNLVNFGQNIDTFQAQNTDQQFENFGQQSENLDQQSHIPQGEEHLEDQEQQVLTVWEPTEKLEQPPELEVVPQKITYKTEEYQSPNNSEENHNKQIVESVQSIQETNKNEDSSPVPITEKPGFWASVGNKFTSAKEKVSSWFQRS